jgi:hypothetical protein
MKKILIVTYDLSNPGRNYEALLKKIKEHKNWARLGGSSYIILVDQTTTVIQTRDILSSVLDENDKLYVSSLGKEAAWKGLGIEVSNWIRDNQK